MQALYVRLVVAQRQNRVHGNNVNNVMSKCKTHIFSMHFT